MGVTNFKTNRNIAQFAAKKVVGKAHTRGDSSDLSEILPSGVQMSMETIFGESIPSGPDNEPTTVLWGVTGTVQKVELVATEINGTIYEADNPTSVYAGDDTDQGPGPHAWSLSLPSNYETVADGSHINVGSGSFVNNQILYESLGKLQIVPTSFYLDSNDPGTNPYAPKIYVWDGSTEGSKNANPLGALDALDWFFDPYNGIVFFQEYDGRVPYKVECYIYIGKYAPDVSGGGGGGAAVGGVQRYVETVTGTLTAGNDLEITGLDLQYVTYEAANLNVYLNGQHLVAGTAQQVIDEDADYHLSAVNAQTYVRFGVDLVDDDVVTLVFIGTEALNTKPLLIWETQNGLDNAQVLQVGDGLEVTNPDIQTFLISNTGLLQRRKVHFQHTGANLLQNGSIVAFSLPSGENAHDFSTVGYDDNRIDIFHEGTLLIKDVHYELTDQDATLATNEIKILSGVIVQTNEYLTAVLF